MGTRRPTTHRARCEQLPWQRDARLRQSTGGEGTTPETRLSIEQFPHRVHVQCTRFRRRSEGVWPSGREYSRAPHARQTPPLWMVNTGVVQGKWVDSGTPSRSAAALRRNGDTSPAAGRQTSPRSGAPLVLRGDGFRLRNGARSLGNGPLATIDEKEKKFLPHSAG